MIGINALLLGDDPALVAALLTTAARTLLALSIAVLIALTLGRGRPGVRRSIWSTAIILVLAMPAMSFALPKWSIAVPSIGTESGFEVREHATEPMPIAPEADRHGATGLPHSAPHQHSHVASAVPAAPTSESFREQTIAWRERVRASALATAAQYWRPAVVGVWIVGAVALLVRLAFGYHSVQRLARGGRPLTRNNDLAIRSALLAVPVRRGVRFVRSDEVGSPLTLGVLRPVVLLPAEYDNWTLDRRRVVLLHELVHVRRFDWVIQIAAQIVTAVHWFNPLAWFAAGRLAIERELACDDAVIATGVRASDYARHLLEISRVCAHSKMPPSTALAMAHRTQMEGRIMSMLRKSNGTNRWHALAAMVAVAGSGVALAAAHPHDEKAEAKIDAIESKISDRLDLLEKLTKLESQLTGDLDLGEIRELHEKLARIRSTDETDTEPEAPLMSMFAHPEDAPEPGHIVIERAHVEPHAEHIVKLQDALRLAHVELDAESSRVAEMQAAIATAMSEAHVAEVKAHRLEEQARPLEMRLAKLHSEHGGDHPEAAALLSRLEALHADHNVLVAEMEPHHMKARELEIKLMPHLEKLERIHAEKIEPIVIELERVREAGAAHPEHGEPAPRIRMERLRVPEGRLERAPRVRVQEAPPAPSGCDCTCGAAPKAPRATAAPSAPSAERARVRFELERAHADRARAEPERRHVRHAERAEDHAAHEREHDARMRELREREREHTQRTREMNERVREHAQRAFEMREREAEAAKRHADSDHETHERQMREAERQVRTAHSQARAAMRQAEAEQRQAAAKVRAEVEAARAAARAKRSSSKAECDGCCVCLGKKDKEEGEVEKR